MPVTLVGVSRGANAALAAGATRSIQGVLAIGAFSTLDLAFDLPDDYYSRYVPAIQAVGEDDVRRVATQYIDPDHLVIAIVGDRKTIEPRIRALDIGSLTTVSIDELFPPAR